MLKKSQTGFTVHTIVIALVCIAAVIAIGVLVKNQIQTQTERKQFLAAQKEVNVLGEQIAKSTNPDKKEAVAYCDYGHVKFGRGERTCWAKYYQLNQNVSKKDALKLMGEAENEIIKTARYEVRNPSSLTSLKSLKYTLNSLGCSTALYFKDEDSLAYNDGNLDWDIPNQSSLIVTSCSGAAKAEYFSVKE